MAGSPRFTAPRSAAHDGPRVVGVGKAQRVADLVRRHLEQDRLARGRAHRGRLREVDPDREANHAGVVHVQMRVAQRPAGRRRDESDHDVGSLLAVLPAEQLDAEPFPGDGVPVVHRAAERRLECGVPRRDEVDGERQAVPRVADRPGRVDRLRGAGPPGRGERAREQERGQGAARGSGGPRGEGSGAGRAGYGSGPATTTVARSGWRWARAASFTCWTVTAR